MRPDDTKITIDETSIYLRPSIGAAFKLVRKYKDMNTLLKKVIASDLTAIGDVIECSALDRNARNVFENCIANLPLAPVMSAIRLPLAIHIGALCGMDRDGLSALQPEEKKKPIRDWLHHFNEMFAIATSFLKWSPEQAWDATPVEIHVAYTKRVEIMEATSGARRSEFDRGWKPHTEPDSDRKEKLIGKTRKKGAQR